MALALGCLAFFGCPPKPPPGDQPMGSYAMSATGGLQRHADGGGIDAGRLLDGGFECPLVEVTGADFAFDAILTRESTSSRAWITLAGYSREGTFDGQVLTSQADAGRVFAACAKCSTRVVETISVALLSRSQNEALGGVCPPDALDGGVVTDPDAGIVGPGQTTQGYDSVRLCGELTTEVVALGLVDGGECEAQCGGCVVQYQLRGERR
ncbi:MAG: hypothetical protein Q8L48_18890 [Archangium sp.]|nr:hypothetical protein [Archangium sp.]